MANAGGEIPFEDLGKAFLAQYYQLFDRKETRPRVSSLYHPSESALCFEGDRVTGAEAIMAKYSTMPLENIAREITTIDIQPMSSNPIMVLIQVLGQLKNDSQHDKVMGFSQTFILRSCDNHFFLYNDIFRLVLHNVAA